MEVTAEGFIHEIIFRIDDQRFLQNFFTRDGHLRRLQQRCIINETVPAEMRNGKRLRDAVGKIFRNKIRGNDVEPVIAQRAANLVHLEVKDIEAQILVRLTKMCDMAVHLDIAKRAEDTDVQLHRL